MNSLESIKKCTEVGVNYYMQTFKHEALENHIISTIKSQSDELVVQEKT